MLDLGICILLHVIRWLQDGWHGWDFMSHRLGEVLLHCSEIDVLPAFVEHSLDFLQEVLEGFPVAASVCLLDGSDVLA